MSLKLICGRSGTGKTERLLQELAASKAEKRFLLVPESFSSEAERLAIARLGGLGLNGVEVYSFRRLARAVREQFGAFGRRHLTSPDRVLLMSTVIDRNMEKLGLLKKAAATPSFVTVLLDLISEWKRYGITPQQLELFVKTAEEGALRQKLQDLGLLYAAYEERLLGHYSDPEDDLTLLCRQLPETSILDGAEWFLDGFYEFTKTELRILSLLMQSGSRMTVALLCDRTCGASAAPFAAVHKTAEKLILTATDAGVSVEETTVLADVHRFSKAKDLAFLESYLAEKPQPVPAEIPNLSIQACSGVEEELQCAAREVLRLCREEGYRFSEMAVLARDLTPYQTLLPQVFRSYGIPVFLDEKVTVLHHATVRFCLLALEAVAGNYAPELMLDYLKTGLLLIPFEMICALENKILREGIRGKDWTTPWEDEFEPIRRQVIEPLETFRQRVAYGVSGSKMAEAFYTLLTDLEVPETLRKKERELLQSGALKEREITRQIWHLLCELLDRVAEWLADDRLTASHFAQILKRTWTNLELGSIPPMRDGLLISDTARVRSGRIRAVFLLGANEGECPKTVFPDGLITDRERTVLQDFGMEMAPVGDARTELEALYLYSALSRGEEKLWISYHQYAGERTFPAYWVQELYEMFPGNPDKTSNRELSAPRPTLRLLTRMLSGEAELTEPLLEAASWFLQQEEYAYRMRRLLYRAGAKNVAQPLSKEALSGIWNRLEQQSVSGIEQYYTCPYRYYLQRMLGAKERELLQFSAPEIGTLVHSALERFSTLAGKTELPDEKSVIRLGLLVWRELQDEYTKLLSYSATFRFVFSRAKKILLRSVLALWEQQNRSAFVQSGQEVRFGYEDGYPALTVPLPDGEQMRFRGVIDRIDRYDDYLRIVDYKTGEKKFSRTELELGTQLQLLLYLKAACNGEQAIPAGVFYFHAMSEWLRESGPIGVETAAKNHRKQYALSGVLLNDLEIARAMDRELESEDCYLPLKVKDGALTGKNVVSAEELEILLELAQDRLHGACLDISAGQIPILPCKSGSKIPCSYCKFHAVCGFDSSLGNGYRGKEEESDDAMDE